MIRVILTDVEGTTTSISFVHEVLFPYAAEHLDEFIRAHQYEAAVSAALDSVAQESGCKRDDLDSLLASLQGWIREDRKVTPLKLLQGMIWRHGYERGDFQSHVYEDAADYLRRWHDRGLRLFVYSSGSVEAQKLIFTHSIAGDLTPFFSDYFDTRVGGKKEADSYRNILEHLGVEPSHVLFLSDVEAELDAAEDVGLRTCLLARAEDSPGSTMDARDRPVARDFAEVDRLLLQD
ncbi:MAG: acireductone synthase [Alteromonadaceae bacterium]|nr:acireductone synthase [Alteromonadaceae bacterium]|tara:strand:+ start:3549 stop:4253 length:705 start_codon:yes stop_codon:yes gene_type:complete